MDQPRMRPMRYYSCDVRDQMQVSSWMAAVGATFVALTKPDRVQEKGPAYDRAVQTR